MNLTIVYAEKNSPSDEWLLVGEVLCENNSFVSKGVPVLEVEGSKAIFEIEAPDNGYFWTFVNSGEQVKVGAAMGVISKDRFEAPPDPLISGKGGSTNHLNQVNGTTTKFTRSALDLISKLEMDSQIFAPYSLVTEQIVREVHSAGIERDQIDLSSFSTLSGIVALGAGNGIWQLAEACGSNNQLLIGALDDRAKDVKGLSIPIFGGLNSEAMQKVANCIPNAKFILSISSNISLRKNLIDEIVKLNLQIGTAIHKNAFVSSHAEIEPGCLVMDSARVGTMAHVGSHVFVSAFVDIEHHCIVGDNSTFGPGVYLSGGVSVGRGCVFGSGVVVEPGISIGDDCLISSGSIITSDLPSNTVVKSKSSEVRRLRASST